MGWKTRPGGTGRLLAAGLALTVALAATVLGPAAGALAAPVTVTNGTQFTDTTGAVVHAHGGGVLKVGDYYYWFGENRNPDNTFRAVSVYRSTDLRTWEFRNNVLTQSSAAELRVSNIERPKVIYNAATGRFVMWMHKENGSDYNEARAAVASSSTVDGAYTYHGSFRPFGQHMSRDITLYNDNGTAYMISAADDNYDLNIYRLTSDYLNVATLVGNFWDGAHREAPAMFKRGSTYFLLTSGATGWSPNQARYATRPASRDRGAAGPTWATAPRSTRSRRSCCRSRAPPAPATSIWVTGGPERGAAQPTTPSTCGCRSASRPPPA
ncbi:family 43 glycosylhydrolase [Micromonospora echinospora]|uniref:family 43 glycosylhydrolase n=1 Tax=Micromonospora echinospora TaxID=1877 RepID=UPI003CF30F6D